MLEAVLEVSATVGAKLVYADNVYMYGPVTGPLTEDMPNTDKTRKGTLRGAMANKVWQAHHSGQVRAVIGRAADMYGPGALNSAFGSTLGQRHFYPALEGKPVSILGNIDVPHTYIFVDDYAQGLITLAERDEALGQVWHIPAAPTITHRELGEWMFREAGHPPRIRGSKISGYFVRLIGLFQADVREVAEMMYQFDRPHIVDHSKFEAAFGANPTPHQEAIRITVDWYRNNPL